MTGDTVTERTDALDNPILNRPYDVPTRYFELGPHGPTGLILDGRRPSESLVPIAASHALIIARGARRPSPSTTEGRTSGTTWSASSRWPRRDDGLLVARRFWTG